MVATRHGEIARRLKRHGIRDGAAADADASREQRRSSARAKRPVTVFTALATRRCGRQDDEDAVAEPLLPPSEPLLSDSEIEASLPNLELLEPATRRVLTALRRQALQPTPVQPFTLPFKPEEIKSIENRTLVRHPPPFGRISKSIYLSKTLPTADLPVHKCDCYSNQQAKPTRRGAAPAPAPAPVPAPEPAPRRRGPKPKAKPKTSATGEAAPEEQLYCGEGCHNRMLFISCSPDTCSAPDPSRCSNRAIKRRETKRVRVEYIPGPGFGLFADETIEAGEFIIEYVGEVIDDAECERRLIKHRDAGETHFYMLEIEKDVVIDARYRSNDARFINHSCDPNSVTQKWNVDGLRRIGIFARRRILAHEEITIDYNFSHFGDPIDCKCGSVACTGQIGAKRAHGVQQALLRVATTAPAARKNLELWDDSQPPAELKRPVLLSSLALLKSAKLEMEWLQLYGFKSRRLFVGHRRAQLAGDVAATASTTASTLSPASSQSSSPLPASAAATPSAARALDNWYVRCLRGDHLAPTRELQSYICGGKADWSAELRDLRRRREPAAPARRASRRRSLLDARARFFADLLAFANGTSKWNRRVATAARIDPDRIYRFIDIMKSGQQFLNQDANDLNEDACHRCGLAGELICCDGCPAAFHLNCTNLALVPPDGEPWFCAECKRKARQRAQLASASVSLVDDCVASKHGDPEPTKRRQARGAHAAPVMPSLKRIFHATTTKELVKRRHRKRQRTTTDRSYRLLEQMPLPTWDDDDDDDDE
ncbi:hypothetical protein P43SY_003370 [Pythium insidiosum]|uniref:Histone-lysine N-methyltransferase n=1 Tax=Pythium insidiosum TaxID=114742 RepID=A0AAD5Q9Y5_PYTIN|nr:hypothetical protein P43SY_003370 [Pythium insidiosum]